MSYGLETCRVRTDNEDGSVTFSAERFLQLGYIHDDEGNRLTVVAGPLLMGKNGKIKVDSVPAEGIPLQILMVPSTWQGV